MPLRLIFGHARLNFSQLRAVLVILFVLLSGHTFAQDADAKRALFLKKIETMPKRDFAGQRMVDTTFRDIVVFSVLSSNNLNISLNNLKKAVIEIRRNSGEFDPTLSISGSTSQTGQLSGVDTDKETITLSNTQSQGVEVGLSQKIPLGLTYSITGGTFEHDTDLSSVTADSYDQVSQTDTPGYFNSYIGLGLNVPVFKLGDSNKSQVMIAAKNAERSKYVTLQLIDQIILTTGTLYYDYYGLFRNYEAQIARLAYSQKLFEETKTRFELGAVDRIKLREVESLLELDRQNLKSIEFQMVNFNFTIKRALNLEFLDYNIYPVFEINVTKVNADFNNLAEEAYGVDPLLSQLEKDREITAIQTDRLTSDDRPDVSLGLNYTLNGYGYTSGQSVSNLSKNKSDSYSASLTWNIPLGNNAKQAQIDQNIIDAAQNDIRISDRKSTIRLNVKQYLENLDLLVLEKKTRETGVNLNTGLLSLEQEKFRLGQTSSLNVIQAQQNLQQAQVLDTLASINYAKKFLELDVLTGEIHEKIEFDPNILFEKNIGQIVKELLRIDINSAESP